VRLLGQIGPLVAVGRLGEPRPELGASRLYVEDTVWQDTVEELLRTARLVVIRTGCTGGLRWEIEKAVRMLTPERLVLVVDSERELIDCLAQVRKVHSHVKQRVTLGWRSIGSIRGFIVFDECWQPSYLRTCGSDLCKGEGNSFVSPSLTFTLRPVFQRLGAEWRRPPFDFSKLMWIPSVAFFLILLLLIIVPIVFAILIWLIGLFMG
jgi:hypothetical protein